MAMIRRLSCLITVLICILGPARAQERVTVGTTRTIANGALFLAAGRGYFKAEGLDLAMTAYASDQAVVEALRLDATDFGLAGFSTAAFKFAGQGAIKAIAAQVREKRDYEGNEIVVSNAAYTRGIRKPENLAKMAVAIGELGSPSHYQLGQIARIKHFDLASVTLKPQASIDAMVRAVASGRVDAAILPGAYARGLLTANQAKLIVWYSELDEQQLGALFASAKTLRGRRATVEKFLRAYRRGVADYATAFLRLDRYSKRISNKNSQEAAKAIARYLYPGRPLASAASAVEADVYYMDPRARLDAADVARQVEWYQAQGLVDKSIDPRAIVDASFK
jgi:NitT/TauT family transport system substrate-binding protein